LPRDRRRRRFLAAPATVTAVGALSVVDTRYEVSSAALTPGKAHVLQLTLDQANNLVKVSVDGAAATTTATVGTHNVQTGSLYLGAGLVDGAVQTTTQTGYIGYAAAYASVLSGAALAAAKAAAAAWLAPVLTVPATLSVAATGTTTFTVTSYVQDPAAYGWQITSATALDANVTVAGTTTTTVSLTTVAAVGTVTSFRVTVASLHAMTPSTSMVVPVLIVAGRYANGFLYRRRILIPAARVSGSAAIANYVFRFYETNASFKDSANSGKVVNGSSGLDIRFETEAGVKLSHDLVLYTPSTGELAADILIPSLSPSTDNRLYIYYGATITASEEAASTVWNSGSYFYILDLTSGSDHVTGNPTWTVSNVTSSTGFSGTRALFNGTSSIVKQSDLTDFTGRSAMTWQIAVRASSGMQNTNRGYFAQGPFNSLDTDHGIVFRHAQTGAQGGAAKCLVFGIKLSTGWMLYESSINLQSANARYYWLVWQSGSLPKLYVDGVLDVPSWVGSIVGAVAAQDNALAGVTAAGSGSIAVGAGSWDSANGGFDGSMAAVVRAMASAMSADQALTEYRNHSDPQTFYGLGGEDISGDSTSAPTAAPLAVAANAGTAKDIDVLAYAYDPDGTVVISSAGSASHGNIFLTAADNTGVIRYTPAETYSGTDRWAYTLSDGTKTATSYILATVAGQATPGTGELPNPLRSITGVNTYAKLAAYVHGTYTDPILGAVGQPTGGDHVFIDDGNYNGNTADPTLTLASPGDDADHPIVFRATNRLGAVIMTKLTITGDYIYLYGLKFDFDTVTSPTRNRCGQVVINGSTGPKILRCEFTNWWNYTSETVSSFTTAGKAGHALSFASNTLPGSGAEVGYCFIHDPHDWSAKEKVVGATNSLRIFLRAYGDTEAKFHKNAHVHHCMFASTITRPTPNTYGSGQADLIEIGDNAPNFPQVDKDNPIAFAGWRVEDCIFDGSGAGGGPVGYSQTDLGGTVDPDGSGVTDVKISGVTYRRCTFRNFGSGRTDIRSGALSRYESCWLDVPSGIQGSFHQFVGNKYNSGGGLWLVTGATTYGIYTGDQQACHNVRCTGNKGTLVVGKHFSTQDIAVDGTIIEAHTGTIKTQIDYPNATWDTKTAGNLESGTTYTDTASETATVPTAALANSTVGPNAAFDAGGTGNAFSLGPDYTDNWTLFTTVHASISQSTAGVTLTAGPTQLAAGNDPEHIQIVSKQAWAGDFKATFDLTRLDASAGTSDAESGLFYFMITGDGTTGHPANILTWSGATGATRFEYQSTGFRMSFDPDGTPSTNDGQIRLRYFPGGNNQNGTQILDNGAPNTQPGGFPFTFAVTYTCTVQRIGTTFTFTRFPTDGGATTRITVDDANVDNAQTGRFIFRMMAGRTFRIENFTVASG
jgi:hypothetical protein